MRSSNFSTPSEIIGAAAGLGFLGVVLAGILATLVSAQPPEEYVAGTSLDGADQMHIGTNTSPENPDRPRWHFRVRDPANLDAAEAELIYQTLRDEMAERYGLSQRPAAENYQDWIRYNTAPYRSASHGRRFLNNYANRTARAYGEYESAGELPVGSILAKDSFAVSEDGTVMPGPLFLMEKMPEGFNYVSGDWRYTMIMPDGSLFGETNGEGAPHVAFCIDCHLAAERNDHLFFLPENYRRN